MNADDVRRIAAESAALQQRFFAESTGRILEVGETIARALRGGAKVLAFGNGGSAADAQNLASELVGRFERERKGLAAIALTTDTSILTAVANDFGFQTVFGRQVEALGRPGDVAVAISTSGRSPNVLAGVRAARALGLVTVGLSGNGGGELAPLVDQLIDVPHPRAARIQEVHIMVVHLLCQIVEEAMGA
jgi:D-sedoheptulose 7-phosphate isomerase